VTRALKIRRQVLLGSALAGTLCTGYLRRAYAACTGAGGTYACSGALTTTQTLNAASLTVTTNSGFGITTASGDALNLTASTGGLSFIDTTGASITGANRGIYAYNQGNLALSISTTGPLSGTTAGAFARNYGTDLTIRTAAVTSAGAGILAYNYGTGALSITATGTVTATAGKGVYARNNGTDLTIQTAAVTSAGTGIHAYNLGTGSLSITSTGTITATTGKGVYAVSYGAGNLTIQTAAVTGGTGGVDGRLLTRGSGSLSITTTGAVTATNGIGVYGRTFGLGLTIQTAAVTGATEGIDGRNIYAGNLSITATGTVTGPAVDGIHAVAGAGSVTIQAVNVSGGLYGIRTYNAGSGALSITATGAVSGGNRGIYAKNYAGTDLTIQVAGASGPSRVGIDARNFGSGTLSITSTGSVNGGVRGIYALTTAGHSIAINTTSLGTIQSGSGAWTFPAIHSVGGPTTITNLGVLTGSVHLDPGFLNGISNGGTWNTLGAGNVFGSADTITNNAGGTIATSMPGAVAPVTTTFSGLASFINAGLISMHNGVAGDQTVITGNFIGRGGAVALDVGLGVDNSAADKLVFKGGSASGTTNMLIYNVGGLGALTTADGIQVVKVQNGGTTTATSFQLGRSVIAGAYTYSLFYGGNAATGGNPSDQDWYLRSILTPNPDPAPIPQPAPNPYPDYRREVPVYLAQSEMANELGLATVDSFDARMEGWRGSIVPDSPPANAFACMAPGDNPDAGCRTTDANSAAANDNEIEASRRSATWGRVFGAIGQQTPGHNWGMTADNDFLNGRGPRYSFGLGGLEAGMDIWRGERADGSSDRVGFYVGYVNASAQVSQVYADAYASNKAGTATIAGYSAGAYWTHFGPSGWYVDSVLQGSWFDQVRGQTALTGMGVTGQALTASLAGGYPLNFGQAWTLEPQAQLIYQHAKLASGVDSYGDTSFGATDDARGRVGVKLSHAGLLDEGAAARRLTFSVRASVWHDVLVNAPSATFSTLTGSFPVTLKGTLGGTSGEVVARADVIVAGNVGLFSSVSYDHSVDRGANWSAGGRLGAQARF
jgi:outer membrane autotransporter protein